MFSDIGVLELVALVVLAVLVFGPDKLPKVIQDVSRTIRKIRQFSDSAKQDIRDELGPDFKDFEFEDLNPKTFLRKQLDQHDELRELKELGESFDFRKDLNDVADSVNGTEPEPAAVPGTSAAKTATPATSATPSSPGTPDLLKKREPVAEERPPYDADAT
ncbi:sec-independent translocase [Streptomyces qinzhouensis]|uniref:Sec-independent protein translocase protein TatB n=1 Tax=Streptomyces qinzhouensis TaxID=2599401 RepID=A0A5B8IK90_9ACTN|nr:sec-independent translocase [Streptomyces qinzhouensis]QDY78882.1 Sec-independent protein translocase subunit TatB [Streptomyces qinzhouensis]